MGKRTNGLVRRAGPLGRRGLLAGVAGMVAAGLAKLSGSDRTHAAHLPADTLTLHSGNANGTALPTQIIITTSSPINAAFAGVYGSIGTLLGTTPDGVQGITNSAQQEGAGVRGMVPQGFGAGVRGVGGTNGIGMWGESTTRVGVFGTCTGGAGIFGVSSAINPNGTGALPLHAGVSGQGFGRIGVQGVSDSDIGVRGQSTSGTGVRGESASGVGIDGTSTTNTAVRGVSTHSFGVAGTSTNNAAVRGESTNSVGVIGISPSRYGVNGVSTSGAGVFGVSDTGFGVYGYSYGTGGSAVGLCGVANSGEGLVGLTQTGIGVHGNAVQSGLAGRFDGKVVVNGTLTVTGGLTTSAIASADGDYRRTYSQESPEPWLEDFGTATLQNGRAEIALDPTLDEVVDGTEYLVFLTPKGIECGLLFISQQSEHGFEVRSYAGPLASGSFNYRVVARRRDVKGDRLERVPAANVNLGKDSPPPPAPRAIADARPATNGPAPRPDANERPRP